MIDPASGLSTTTRARTLIHILGVRRYLYYVLKLPELRDYFLRIYYCHHNARVLADMETRLGMVLCYTTRGMSKPYYSWEAMKSEIEAYQTDLCDEAIAEYKQAHSCHCDERAVPDAQTP